jgi:hypothetical protein
LRRCGPVVVAIVALFTAACGSKSNTASQTASASTPPTTPATASSSGTDCNTLGINPTQMREGTCTHAGITYVIVDGDHSLKLRTLTAKLSGVRTATSLTGSEPATSQGRFVIVSITITNRTQLAQTFDKSGTQQAGLILDGTVYKEDAGVETHSDPKSCLSAAVSLASGQTQSCQVDFDVPTASAGDLGKHGRADLYLVDFGSDLSGSIAPQTVGQIRLYR